MLKIVSVFLIFGFYMSVTALQGDTETVCYDQALNVTSGNDEIDELKTKLAEQGRSIEQLKNVLEKIGYSMSGYKLNTSFMAVHTSSQAVAPEAVVYFRTLRHNLAPPNFGYDEKISFFRCPYTGVYAFQANLVTSSKSETYMFSLVREGTILSSSYLTTDASTTYTTMGLSAVAPCRRGEDVWVKNIYSYTRSLYSNGNGISTFSGYKIN